MPIQQGLLDAGSILLEFGVAWYPDESKGWHTGKIINKYRQSVLMLIEYNKYIYYILYESKVEVYIEYLLFVICNNSYKIETNKKVYIKLY